ncbi:glycosyltransferase family 4 protein [Desulfosarcina alkanivorans]|nr:glycosyltransferase family 4 protein [Desulfosarcina alkanivorans]
MLGSYPPLRGISSYCFELATSIAGSDCEVEFLSFKQMYPAFLYPGRDLKDDDTFPSCHDPHLHVKRKMAWYNPLGWISEGLTTNASILHAQWWSLPLAPAYLCLCCLFKIRRKPIVFTVHNVMPHERSPWFYHLSRLLFSMGDHFIVHSSRNRKQLVDFYGISPDAISQIPHGPLDFQVNPDADREKIRTGLGFKPAHKVVLLFGAIRPYKGVDTAVKAFARLRTRIPSARLLIVGKLWQSWAPYEELIAHCGIPDRVKTRLGYIPSAEVHRYFCAADLVILPYHHFDSQSGVGGTAVSFRKPLIVSKVGGLPDLVLDTGAIIPPMDSEALSEAIARCLENSARLLKMANDADRVAQTLSWTTIAKRTIKVYEKQIAKSRHRSALIPTGNAR